MMRDLNGVNAAQRGAVPQKGALCLRTCQVGVACAEPAPRAHVLWRHQEHHWGGQVWELRCVGPAPCH